MPLSLTIDRGPAAPADDGVQLAGDPQARERGVGHQRQAFARAVVDHRQDAEPATVGQLVGDEVQAPALVGTQRRLHRPPCTHGPLAPAAPAHRQPLLAINPLDPLLVHQPALAPQQHVQAPIAEPPPLLRQRPQPLAQLAIVRPRGLIANACPVGPDHPARPPLAHLEGRLQDVPQPLVAPRASPLFSQEILQRRIVQHRVRQHPLQLARSHPPAPSDAWPQRRPCRQTWPSTCRRSPS